ncbi:hypothetical protein KC19_VG318600 [Ceratodon purpureus]|uniref:Uncharacterized protein n=1 Tax=Ceratodon purpureus TaxID=3225 RepID=A0A8T0HVI3_CERPU|nr:hypothetical protein KC19_VG318600 [Ceratodon purpureus]
MDKEAILGWLVEIYRLKAKHHLTYPDVPCIGQFVHFSNKFRWNDGYYQEMVALSNALGLHFPDYFNRCRSPIRRLQTRAEHAAMVRRYNDKRRDVKAKASPVDTSEQDSTCNTISSQASCPGSQIDASAEFPVYRVCASPKALNIPRFPILTTRHLRL